LGGGPSREPACKPDPVPACRRAAAIHLGRTLPSASCDLPGGPLSRRAGHPFPLLGLAPDGVYLAAPVTRHAGELLPHRFTLTRETSGGLLSVALATGHPAWDFPQRPALWSPDFPRWERLVPTPTAAARPALMLIMQPCPPYEPGASRARCRGSCAGRHGRMLQAGAGRAARRAPHFLLHLSRPNRATSLRRRQRNDEG
jgi:hypothetical protein